MMPEEDITLIDLLDDFRQLKLGFDSKRYSFLSYRLGVLIEKYNQMIQLRKEIQESYFTCVDVIHEEGLEINFDANRWERVRSVEDSEWKFEIDEIDEIKHGIDDVMALIESGIAEQMIIEEEERLTGDKVRRE